MAEALLDVRRLCMAFGGVIALENVSLDVTAGSVTSLIGPNGAGKTTLFNCLTGFYKATGGAIELNTGAHPIDVIELLGRSFRAKDFVQPATFARLLFFKAFGGSHRVNRAGIARTFQNIRLFREMSVIENLLVAQHRYLVKNPISGMFNTARYRRSEAKARNNAFRWLEFVGLTEHANRLAGELAYGLQRKLEIARAMCTQPNIICLDEPAAGLNPAETSELKAIIRNIKEQCSTTVLLIEHDMGLVMDISDKIYVLDHGEVIASGAPEAIATNKAVIAAYLGIEAEEDGFGSTAS